MGFRVMQLEKIQLKGYEEDDIFGRILHEGRFFEQDILDAWKPFYQNAAIILDVGANLGNHSVYWAVETGAQVYAFEPFPLNYDLLKGNIARNYLDQIHIEQKAVGGKNTTAVLVGAVSTEHLGNAAFSYEENKRQSNSEDNDPAGRADPARVEMITLDCWKAGKNLNKIDFVKIDTEGFELEVLAGMQEILKKDRPILWIETEADHAEQLCAFLNERGYRLQDIQAMNTLFLPEEISPDMQAITQAAMLRMILKLRDRALQAETKYGRLLDEIQRKENE